MSQIRHYLKGIGEIVIVRRKGTSRISIRLRPFEPVRCVAPREISTREVLQFVEEHRGWIERKRGRLDSIEDQRTVFTEESVFQTRYHTLDISRDGVESPVARIGNRAIRITMPQHSDLRSPENQEWIRKVIEKTLRIEAKAVLPYRLSALAHEHDLSFSGVSLRAQRRRWGSCSAADRISLNVHLMRLPDHLIDYVLLHELAHTVHKNHSKQFWQFLDTITGGQGKAFDRELRNYSPTVF